MKFLLAHRPGFISPTLAARKLATLDHYTGGRLLVHIITGGRNAEQRRDGDYLTHDERYARTDEYLDILRNVWTRREPFSHDGTYYRFDNAFSELKPLQASGIPISFGGASEHVLDQRLFMGVAKATNAPGNTTAVVGTASQVADSLLAYYGAGISGFLFRGFDPRSDAVEFGCELIPLLREGARRIDVAAARPREPDLRSGPRGAYHLSG